MKKMCGTFVTSLMVLGLTVAANAGYIGGARAQRGQTYQMRQTTTGTSLGEVKIGIGFNKQIYVGGPENVTLTVPGGPGGAAITLPQPFAPADISVRVLVGDFGGEFDIGGDQYAIKGTGDVNTFDVGLKGFYALISKSYVKFNAGLALMYSDEDSKGIGAMIGTGFDFIAGPEFFIPQLPELGFNVEIGLGYHSYSFSHDVFAADDLGTRASDFLQAGIHYYF
ncbi:MAG: hypothetical protein M1491_04865 [Deltaproteobacteria bacterium]|nr:hypothetical protein [Deltaproteobacteria bacterium]MCL5277518.1 hypothetical protein [Deltaproteobacteria bacterium]